MDTTQKLEAELAAATPGTPEAWALRNELNRRPALDTSLVAKVSQVISDTRELNSGASAAIHGDHFHQGTAKGLITRQITKLRKAIRPSDRAAYVDAAEARLANRDRNYFGDAYPAVARFTPAAVESVRDRLTA